MRYVKMFSQISSIHDYPFIGMGSEVGVYCIILWCMALMISHKRCFRVAVKLPPKKENLHSYFIIIDLLCRLRMRILS